MLGKRPAYMTSRSSFSSRPRNGASGLSPVSDIVSAPSTSSIDPPIASPGAEKFSPLVGGLTRHSSGWMTGQW